MYANSSSSTWLKPKLWTKISKANRIWTCNPTASRILCKVWAKDRTTYHARRQLQLHWRPQSLDGNGWIPTTHRLWMVRQRKYRCERLRCKGLRTPMPRKGSVWMVQQMPLVRTSQSRLETCNLWPLRTLNIIDSSENMTKLLKWKFLQTHNSFFHRI